MTTAIALCTTEMYCGQGTSDKVYNMYLVEVDGGHKVRIEYGKRWNANNVYFLPKDEPTDFGGAQLIMHQQEQKKLKKGYYVTDKDWS